MRDLSKIKYLVVHKHPFHADDVFTTAYVYTLMEKLYGREDLEFIRTFTPTEDMTFENGYLVADIGKGEFDHHFPEDQKQHRENGIAYAAFGLVVREFHEGLLTEDEYKKFDKTFIEGLDEHDNTGIGNPLSMAIGAFNANWNDEDQFDNNNVKFKAAVSVAKKILDATIARIKAESEAEHIAKSAEVKYHTVWLPQYVPATGMFMNDDNALFMGSNNANRGVYTVQALRASDGSNKALFPEKFRGFNSNEAPNEYGMGFCHASGFLASFNSEESARNFMFLMDAGFDFSKEMTQALEFLED